MELFHDRPLALSAAAFVAASVAAYCASGRYKLMAAVIIAVFLAIVLILSLLNRGRITELARTHRARIAGVAVAVILAIIVSYIHMDVWYASVKARGGERAEIRGYVTERIYESSYLSSYRVTLTEINGEPCSIGALLEADFAAGLSVGSEFSADAELRALSIDGGFDEEAYYLPRGVFITASVGDADALAAGRKHESIDVTVARMRGKISSILEVMFDGEEDHGIPEALFVGQRGALDDAVYRDFRYIGAAHLLAVSGMHLTILIGGVEAILRRFFGKTPRNLILIFSTIAYMALTGFSSSVVRAGLMLVIYYASHFARREPDSVTSLFAASSAIILVSPASAADIGFLLSVTAMLGCIFANGLFVTDTVRGAFSRLGKRGFIGKCVSRASMWIYCSVAISLSAMLFTLPVVWLSFGRISLLSPVATLCMSLPVTWILYLCPVMIVTSGISAIATPLSSLCGALCRFVAWESSTLARIDGAGVSLSGEFLPAAFGCVIITACIMAALVMGKRAALHAVAAAGAIFVFIAVSSGIYFAVYDADSVTYVNCGKNDGFVATDGNRVLLCDISDGSWTPTSLLAETSDAERIDVYMLTHLHLRHVRTFERLCRREYVREVWIPTPENEGEAEVYESICESAEKYGVTVTEYERGDVLRFGSVTVETIPRTMIGRSTHPVLALAFAVDEGRTVYVGSSVHESEIYEYTVDMCQGADEVIFGIHGPVYKSGAPYYLAGGVRVTYAAAEIAEYLIDYNLTDEFSVCGE